MSASLRSLLVVEDEPLISILIEDMARELGWTIEGSVQSEAAALHLLGACQPAVALLDIDLGSTSSFGIATACRIRHIPVVFVTGYSAKDLPADCADTPVLTKPFSSEDLDLVLRHALNQQERSAPGSPVPSPNPQKPAIGVRLSSLKTS